MGIVMEKENNQVNTETTSDETGYINTDELRDVLKEEKQKKECWLKRIFTRQNKKDRK